MLVGIMPGSEKVLRVSCLILSTPGMGTVPSPHLQCKSFIREVNKREKAEVKVLLVLYNILLPG